VFADAGRRLDDALFVEIVAAVTKEVVEDEAINEEGSLISREGLHLGDHGGLGTGIGHQTGPLEVEPLTE
jgi:hypothetical protein